MEVEYLFDTYALFEVVRGNPLYIRYSGCIICTSFLNLMELYWCVLRDFGEDRAQQEYVRFKPCLLEITDAVLFEAMNFRIKYKNKDFSYADCIGYILAQKNNLKFLTGDNAFKGMSNVEFVK